MADDAIFMSSEDEFPSTRVGSGGQHLKQEANVGFASRAELESTVSRRSRILSLESPVEAIRAFPPLLQVRE
jgi:hypothetical protein